MVVALSSVRPGIADDDAPVGYVCGRASTPLVIDGRLDEPDWERAPWTADFGDIEGAAKAAPRFRTRVKMLWDDERFYIAAELSEPHVQGTFTQRDSYIFHEDNDFEVFLDPDGDNHRYGEIEMNALNTVWDLRLVKPYRDGGPAEDGWNVEGLQTAVYVDGTINDPSDVDRAWTIEMAIPFSALGEILPKAAAPRRGDQWRVNFSRVEWRYDAQGGKYVRRKDRREDNWTWAPQGAIDMHRPERWGYVQFAQGAAADEEFRPDPAHAARRLLQRIYDAQHAYKQQHWRFAPSLSALGVQVAAADGMVGAPRVEAADDGFAATASVHTPDGETQVWTIRHDSRIERSDRMKSRK